MPIVPRYHPITDEQLFILRAQRAASMEQLLQQIHRIDQQLQRRREAHTRRLRRQAARASRKRAIDWAQPELQLEIARLQLAGMAPDPLADQHQKEVHDR